MSRHNDLLLRQLSSRVDPDNDTVVASLANAYRQAAVEAGIRDEIRKVVNGSSRPRGIGKLTSSESYRSFFGFANLAPRGGQIYEPAKLPSIKTGPSSPTRVFTRKMKQYIDSKSDRLFSNYTLRNLNPVRKSMLRHRLEPLTSTGHYS